MLKLGVEVYGLERVGVVGSLFTTGPPVGIDRLGSFACLSDGLIGWPDLFRIDRICEAG